MRCLTACILCLLRRAEFGKQLERANKLGVSWTVIQGEDELLIEQFLPDGGPALRVRHELRVDPGLVLIDFRLEARDRSVERFAVAPGQRAGGGALTLVYAYTVGAPSIAARRARSSLRS